MKTEDKLVQRLIDYLEANLCGEDGNRFTKTGPRTFFYTDDVDTIFVKVTDENFIIITDGEDVCDGMEFQRLLLTDDEEIEDNLYNKYLQSILRMF
jgi:hypothetical protein